MKVIETQRLRIRQWNLPGDEAAAAAMFCDPEVMRYIPVGVRGPEDVPAILQRMNERAERDGFPLGAVVEKATERVIGESGLTYIPDTRDVEVAWFLARSEWGKGYASEAARAMLEFAFSERRLPRVYSLIDRENARSIAVANRLGMRFDRIVRAYRRDLMRYVTGEPEKKYGADDEAAVIGALVAAGA